MFGSILKHKPKFVDMRGVQNITLLMHAARYDRSDIVHMLIINGCDVRVSNAFGSSAYHQAAGRSAASLRLLLEHDASHVNDVNDKGETPLHWVVHWNNIEAVRLLLQYKANQTIRDKYNVTALDMAERRNRHKIVDLLKNK